MDVPAKAGKSNPTKLANDVCSICLEIVHQGQGGAYTHPKCQASFCSSCMGAYVRLKITQGSWDLECANCNNLLSGDTINQYLKGYPLLQDHFRRLVAEANRDPHMKTCPNCCRLHHAEKDKAKLIVCPGCQFHWCFSCHAPWHKGMKCKDFKRGSKLFKEWTKDKSKGSANARPCPNCKVFIQRLEGCDHMSCPRCHTQFCYLCGGRIVYSKLFGNHWSVYSALGCRYIYRPNQPIQRKLVRGFFLTVVLTSLPVLAAGFIAMSPLYGIYRLSRCARRPKLHSE